MTIKQSRVLTHIGLIVASLCTAVIGAEVVLRVAGISYPVFDDFDESRGVRLRPGKQGWYRAEGEAYVSINSLGYRDREHERRKPEGTFRIAVLGDSFVEARQVSLSDTFWYRLGPLLESCPLLEGKQVEMLSFGVGGYNTSQEYLTLDQHVRLFSPDLVLLAMFAANDIEGNSPTLQESSSWRIVAPTHALIGDQLVLRHSVGHSVWRRLLYELVHRFRTIELINEVRRAMRTRAWQSRGPNDIEAGLSSNIYKEPQSPEWREAWLVTAALLQKMSGLTQTMGARFVVTTIPEAIEVDPIGERRQQFEQHIGVDDLLYPDEQITRIGFEHGFRVHALTRDLQRRAAQRKIYMHGFANTRFGLGHLNAQGHDLVAELLATKLCNATDLGTDDQRMAESR